MKKTANIFLSFVLIFSILFTPVFSQSVDDLEGKLDQKNQEVKDKESTLDKIKREIEAINNSSASLDEKIKLINKELAVVQAYVNDSKKSLDAKTQSLKVKESVVALSKKQLNTLSSVLYKTSRFGILDYFFMNGSEGDSLSGIFYKQYILSKKIESFKTKRLEYAQINSEKLKIEQDKKDLEKELAQLDEIKASVIKQKNEYQGLIATKSSQTTTLKKQIGLLKDEISDLQVAILVAKNGSASFSAGDVPSGGAGSLASFQSGANSGDFGVFSYGAFTHRNGMSQWGARARADAGQTYTQILKAYYPGHPIKTGKVVVGSTEKNIMTKIKTTDYGTLDFETNYLLRLGEMPESWPLEVLKAQAIAARTYAVNYTVNGANTICVTQACQVILPNKKTGRWKTAVEQTAGMILTNGNGTTFSAQYAAVHGGWENNVGWDTSDRKGPPNSWVTNAWDNKSGVSWFYQAWNTFSPSVTACGAHPKAWLNTAEMSDLLNTYLVIKNNGVKGSVNTARILPETTNTCKISGISGNPYSKLEMSNLLTSPVSSIQNPVSVSQGSNGLTQYIIFKTNRGNIQISGADFKQVFNMRAPGYLSIPQNNYVFIDVLRK